MKKRLAALCLLTVIFCVIVLAGCADQKASTPVDHTAHYGEYQKVTTVGQVPDALQQVVANNGFYNITAFEGRLLKAEICATDEDARTVTQTVQMMDRFGNRLADYTVNSGDAYHVTTLTATDDGGFLFVLGFRDYAYHQGAWASDNGFASRILKCDKNGNLQFDIPLDRVEGSALEFCFEKDSKFYFFGTMQAPETKQQGVQSYTDIYMAILDKNGSVLKSKRIAGSDYDSLDAAEQVDSGFILSIRSQSGDGDFSGSDSNGYPADWVIAVDDALEITEKKRESGRDLFDTKIGEKDGIPVYKSDALFKNFDAGAASAFIDYGDFYLIVSENITGVYEHTPPVISSIWYYTETVYSGYDESGNLLFRTAVDSSPDYDAKAARFD